MAHRKDYRAIAAILKGYRMAVEDAVDFENKENVVKMFEFLTEDIAAYFKEDNQYFNKPKFVEASTSDKKLKYEKQSYNEKENI